MQQYHAANLSLADCAPSQRVSLCAPSAEAMTQIDLFIPSTHIICNCMLMRNRTVMVEDGRTQVKEKCMASSHGVDSMNDVAVFQKLVAFSLDLLMQLCICV